LSDVPIGVTLSGGIDSSIITGILSEFYNDEIHVFSAQSPDSKFDESVYVNAVIKKCRNSKMKLHMRDLNSLSVQRDLEKFLKIQGEPFGDPSIIAHGFLMEMAANEGIKVILNGQGADEIFFGYNNLVQAILPFQLRSLQLGKYTQNIKGMNLGKTFILRTFLQAFFPELEYSIRKKSRAAKRHIITDELVNGVDEDTINMYSYGNLYNVWKEAIYGVQLPHLVHYDDRNGMAYSIEGRMPFLDHRIAELVATIQPSEFIRGGKRKFLLREACRKYLPDEVYNRTDKIGFYTPLQNALVNDKAWVQQKLTGSADFKKENLDGLLKKLESGNIDLNTALYIWRNLSTELWRQLFNIK
jgi:asparagine synthase (glutamine-hydrolysing)